MARQAVRTNGAKLLMKRSGDSDFVNLEGLQSIPEIGAQPEKIETTTLASKNKTYMAGIGDLPEMAYTFLFLNESAEDAYAKLAIMSENEESAEFKHQLEDGTNFTFTAIPFVTVSGGEVNSVITFTVTLTVSSDIVKENPYS